MKIAMINSVCYGSTGRICRDNMRALKAAGRGARLFYGRGAGPKDGDTVRFSGMADVYAHVLLARLTDGQGFCASRRATGRLIELLDGYQPDVIHLHQPHGYYLHLPTLFRYLKGCARPVVWSLHDCWTVTGHCAYFTAAGCERWREDCGRCPQKSAYPAAWIDRSAQNLLKKRALFCGVPNLTLVTPSAWLKSVVERSALSKYPVQVIPNGVDRTVFCPPSEESGQSAGPRRGENGALILGAANVWEPRKGLDVFFALRKLLPESMRILLVGLSKAQIRALPPGIEGRERTANARELAALYRMADVFVNPSSEDNYPTTHLEALCCGTPVVTFDVGGCREALTDACGIAVPFGDTAALARAVQRALLLQRADCLARAEAFGCEQTAAAHLALYESVLHGERR